ncbi:hypothetical protein [Epilithonimonas mollis]|uniref:Rieske domain-containing protein n=1 Tax=Epilithonimonas mollis TaxID=216903 RepID=A0A1M6PCX9_9FLAO|nr:hypothetical protein [Epilithonimonas mollis]SHK05811.1 hypothetical protein SAMN05444371_1016 [Epilithonimonas mollis]
MKTKKNASLFTLFLIISLLSINNSCSERNETVSCFPNSPINAIINLSLPTYYNLLTPNSWAYTRGEPGTGTQGLIIYSTSNGFMVYDRNAPHLCPEGEKTVLNVDNGGTFVICPKDNAKWALFNGQPQEGENVPKTGLKTYRYYDYNPNTKVLTIYSN